MLRMLQAEMYQWNGRGDTNTIGIYHYVNTKTDEQGYVKITVPDHWYRNVELFLQVAAHHAYTAGTRNYGFSDAQYLIDKPYKFGDAVIEYLVEVEGEGGDGLKWLFDVCQMWDIAIEHTEYEKPTDD